MTLQNNENSTILRNEIRLIIIFLVHTVILFLNECLDWQPSQFINIVGKDDVARSGSGGGEVPADPRHSLPVVRVDQPSRILPSHSETFPPTHPRIVTASGRYW